MKLFTLHAECIDVQALRVALVNPAAGACACFEGWVRDHHQGRRVRGLRYQAYTALAEAEGSRIVSEAIQRFDLCAAHCAHRVGELALGELAVWVGASSAHRVAAFAGCRWIIDEVKASVPIWKHEHYVDGTSVWQHPQTR